MTAAELLSKCEAIAADEVATQVKAAGVIRQAAVGLLEPWLYRLASAVLARLAREIPPLVRSMTIAEIEKL